MSVCSPCSIPETTRAPPSSVRQAERFRHFHKRVVDDVGHDQGKWPGHLLQGRRRHLHDSLETIARDICGSCRHRLRVIVDGQYRIGAEQGGRHAEDTGAGTDIEDPAAAAAS